MRKLIFIGDLHRNFQWLENTILDYKDSDVILVGDIEFCFSNREWLKWFESFNKDLEKNNIHIYGIRGNHDDPLYWFDQTYTFSNVHLVKDYTVLNLKYNILCVGGATSIDRKLKRNYSKEEEFNYDEDILNSIENIDIVVTHSAPEFCFPRGYDTPFLKTYYDIDPELRSDLINERALLNRMYDVLSHKNNIKYYFYGHFHRSKTEIIYGTEFKLLKICEIFELK